MNSTDFLSLYSVELKEQINNNLKSFEKINKELRSTYEKEKHECTNDYSISKVERERRKHIIQTIYEQEKHDLFVQYCLAPEGYKNNNGEVFACVVGKERNKDYTNINISVVTPSMAYIDNRYFVSGNNDEDYIWWKEYRPYYYEFTTTLSKDELKRFNSQIKELKNNTDSSNKDCFWFKAKLKEISKLETSGLSGIVHFGGSPSHSESITITSFETVDDDILQKLNQTYKVTFRSNKCACRKFLSQQFGCDYQYKVRVLNVGQANCIYVKNKNTNYRFFFDLGRPNSDFNDKNSGKRVPNLDLQTNKYIVRNLNRLSKISPNCIIISHWHGDHFAAFKDINDNARKSVWILPKIRNDADIKSANRLFKYLINQNTEVYYLSSIGQIYDNSFGFQLLRSKHANKSDPNSRGLILRIKDTLFPGDCLYRFWPDELTNNLNDINRLIVPHHSSKLDPGLAKNLKIFSLFNKTAGKDAYISVGFNTYNHPNQDHIDELTKASFNLYLTSNTRSYYEFDIN